MNLFSDWQDTIVALATPPGVGAIGVIRLSGSQSLSITDALFPSKKIAEQVSHTIHVGNLYHDDLLLDEVVVSIFKNPKSYTGEDVVEISCHGSPYIQQKIIAACIALGARLARPGEFTQRAFLNGKLDLAQAEAVADVIAANTQAAQETALKQLKGGFSSELKLLRDELIQFASLIELELDFSDEDVEFADRESFKILLQKIKTATTQLIDSFGLGNAIKNGVRVAIIGKPNAGKSTLLNALLNEDRAIVSDIAGTTRDTIEEVLNIRGILFRLIDTAGIREHSSDSIETLGMERSRHNAERADMILHVVDVTDDDTNIAEWLQLFSNKTITVYNKTDARHDFIIPHADNAVAIAAKDRTGIAGLEKLMFEKAIGDTLHTENTIVTNARHHAALLKVAESLQSIEAGMEAALSGDLIAIDIRRCLHYLGEITGQVEVDRDILGTIFSKFCIGK